MTLARFFKDRRANVAPIFAIAILPIIGFVGAAVDYSRATSVKVAMQAALDAAALMLSKEAQGLTADQISSKADAYFKALFNRTDVRDLSTTASFVSPQAGNFVMTVTAHVSVDTVFMRIFGTDESSMGVGASAEVQWGIKKLELALVLDNTGSMAQSGKISALKEAAKNLLTTLKNSAKKDGDVKVAIIPFDTHVNIGSAYKNETWVNFSVNSVTKSTWTGCVQDRNKSNTPSLSYNVLDTTPVDTATSFPAVSTCGSLVSAMPLSFDWTALSNKIDSMSAAGNTNVTIGFAWGWHALTPNLPFTQASPPTADLDKVIVLLTDGDNTQDRWSSSASAIDPRTAAVCANIKAANIKIYTIRVIDGNQTLLRNCATKTDMYYEVTQASQLNGVFTAIAQKLANLRLSK
jgi:Flp pilus assembly protein TadG